MRSGAERGPGARETTHLDHMWTCDCRRCIRERRIHRLGWLAVSVMVLVGLSLLAAVVEAIR